jgi:hypothetical protein
MLSLVGLLKIEFPTRTVRLCDGGFITFGGETYTSADDVFGNIASLEPLSEGIGDEVPALELTLQPPSTTATADLSQPGFQQARARFWIAEFNPETGQIVGTPDLTFEGQIDQTSVRIARGERSLSIVIVSTAERLFERNIGNTLSPTFHKSIWPGELGHDNAIGLKVPIAWGVAGPVRAFGSGAGGSGGAGRFGNPGSSSVDRV